MGAERSMLCCILMSTMAAAGWAQAPPLAETLDNHLIGEIRIGGAVLDHATGEPLAQVRFSAEPALLEAEKMAMRRLPRHREEVTGAFRFQCSPCSQVRVRFSKPGYRSESLSFAVQEGVSVDQTRLQVRLQPLQDPVRLYRMDGDMVAAPNEKARSVTLELAEHRSWSAGPDRLPAKSALNDQLFLLSLGVQIDDDGQALTHRVVEKKAPGNAIAVAHDRPVDAWLDVAGPAGIQLYEPESKRPRPALRSMAQAPVDGYVERLALGSTTEKTYFFLQVGDRHGKGYVEAPWVDNDGHVRARVHVWMNDGGRSLEDAYE